ncbi:MAG: hypothetical protein ACKVY0_24650 [Prosthecobacter sp.]|uniref:hypothetical protein n=1 Tax=Prosthecobacter sp. TaxID=1965333 RepID=UPI0038FD6DD9
MKSHALLFLALVTVLAAQDKPKDPFVKDKKAATAAPAAAAEPEPDVPEAPKNVLCFIETFTLSHTDYAALLDAPEGQDKLYSHVQAAVKTGTAKLDGCHLMTNKSGTRSTLESVDELIYPTEWTPADRTGSQYPTAFEMRQLGDKFEFEPTLDDENGTLNITHEFSRDRLLGIRLFKADATLAGVPVVDVFARRGPSSCRMIPGFPTLISTLNDVQPGIITLVFATAQVITLKAPKEPAAKSKSNLMLTARVISIDRMKGWELLKKHAMEGGACLAELKPMLAAKEATLEHLATINTQSGVRATHESGLLYTYGTEYAPPTEGVPAQPSDDPKKPGTPARPAGLAGTTAFEQRSTGFRLEVEPTRSADNAFSDLTLAPEFVRMTGNLKDKNWNEHYPEVPLFSNQKITTGYTQVIGTTTLIGTMNPPGDTGANEHKDEGRMWLLFMDVNQE